MYFEGKTSTLRYIEVTIAVWAEGDYSIRGT